jgi:hypothetical protein
MREMQIQNSYLNIVGNLRYQAALSPNSGIKQPLKKPL